VVRSLRRPPQVVPSAGTARGNLGINIAFGFGGFVARVRCGGIKRAERLLGLAHGEVHRPERDVILAGADGELGGSLKRACRLGISLLGGIKPGERIPCPFDRLEPG